ncbi:MAG: peptide deformylase [Candidatus Omnitrophica bacterium]|nr:peptide deformylase [Candidatus Omnitrophota bacterium]
MKNDLPFSIIKQPAAVLRKKARRIKRVTDEHRLILEKMVAAMKKSKGMGLAGPQVGLDLQIAVVDTGEGLLKIINPSIVKKDGYDTMDEACLSVPNALVRVKRSGRITVKYTDEWGKQATRIFVGLTAKAIQHEVDHLNGRLIVDYQPWYKRIFKQ